MSAKKHKAPTLVGRFCRRCGGPVIQHESTYRCEACGIGYTVGSRGDFVMPRPSQLAVLPEPAKEARRSPTDLMRLVAHFVGRLVRRTRSWLGRFAVGSEDSRVDKRVILAILALTTVGGALVALMLN